MIKFPVKTILLLINTFLICQLFILSVNTFFYGIQIVFNVELEDTNTLRNMGKSQK